MPSTFLVVHNLNLQPPGGRGAVPTPLGALPQPSHQSPPHISAFAAWAASGSVVPCTLGLCLPGLHVGLQKRQASCFHGLNNLCLCWQNAAWDLCWMSESPPPHRGDLPWAKELFTARSDREGWGLQCRQMGMWTPKHTATRAVLKKSSLSVGATHGFTARVVPFPKATLSPVRYTISLGL